MSKAIGETGPNNLLPVVCSRGWKTSAGATNEPEPFFWVMVTAGNIEEKTVCIDTGISGEITPIVVYPQQLFPIKGIGIRASGNDRKGNTFTTSSGIEIFVYGGAS